MGFRDVLVGLVIICLGWLGYGNAENILDVTTFGAVGDGKTDDSEAFLKAWKTACEGNDVQILHVPPKSFFLHPITFWGPCKSTIYFRLQGVLVAPDPNQWKAASKKNIWIDFKKVDNLSIYGEGRIDGNGAAWWPIVKNSNGPKSIRFLDCNKLKVNQITSMNTPKNHFSIGGCTNVDIAQVNVFAPQDSPNTDGFDISNSKEVNIYDSYIGTGDDCVALNGGNYGIYINNVTCGPGHGISVGSLGRNGMTETVENVHVTNSTFKGTQNGARIKTCPGGSGHVSNIKFENIILDEVRNPIIINQQYNHCPGEGVKGSVVEIRDVKFIGFRGTSTVKKTIQLNCSESKGCEDIVLDDINIQPGSGVKEMVAVCQNVHGTATKTIPIVSCFE